MLQILEYRICIYLFCLTKKLHNIENYFSTLSNNEKLFRAEYLMKVRQHYLQKHSIGFQEKLKLSTVKEFS